MNFLVHGSISSSFKRVKNIVNNITFTNPTIHKIWRNGVENTGTIIGPTGYDISWEIINHNTRAVVDSGTGSSVTSTFTFTSMANCNTYDLLVTVTDGVKIFKKIFLFEFTCLPVAPTTFDLQISAATFSSVTWVSRPGYRIRVYGTITSGTVDLRKYKSDDPTQPIHIVFDNVTIDSATWDVKIQMLKNVILDGCTSESIQYGCRMTKKDGGINQMLVFDWNGTGGEIDYFSQNVYICGFECNGRNVAGNGNTAFRILPGGRNAVVNSTTRQFTGLMLFNCKGYSNHEEVYYLGYFGDTPDVNGYSHSYIDGAYVFNCIGYDGGLDVFQITAHNSVIARCYFKDGGYRDDPNHENCVQIGSSYNVVLTQCWMEQSAAHNMLFLANGYYGGFCEVFGNIFHSSVGPGNAGNIWIRADLSTPYTTIEQKVYNNTMYYADDHAFRLYEATATDFDKIELVGNAVVSFSTSDYTNGSGFIASHGTFSNYKVLLANISTVGFVDYVLKNYKPASLSSLLYGTSTDIVKTSPLANYDFEGVEYKLGFPIRGAYSGYELLTQEPFSIVGATDQVINGHTYNVHSAELDHSIKRFGNIFRFEVNQGECRASESDLERSELSYGSGSAFAYGTNLWTAYSFQIAENSVWDVPANVCGQFHAGVGSPNLSIRVNTENELKVVIRAGLSSSYTETVAYTDAAFIPGKWYNLVMNTVFSAGTATGTVKVWIDGVQVVNLTSYITGYSDASSTYFKFGIYRSTSAPENEVVYYANVETGTTDLTDRILNPLAI